MAFFSRKPKQEEKPQEQAAMTAPVAHKVPTRGKHPSQILLSPRITEKGAYLGELGVYVFNVQKNAGKREIAQAIRTVFGVMPRKVRVVSIPRKQVSTRGTNRMGQTKGGKKAYVYLKKGDAIEIA